MIHTSQDNCHHIALQNCLIQTTDTVFNALRGSFLGVS